MIKKIGSNYGGWFIDLGLIPENSTVISAGLGNDITFDEELIRRKNCLIIGIDPTKLTKDTIKRKKIEGKNFIYLKKGLYSNDAGFKMTNLNTNGNSMYSADPVLMPTISIPTLLNEHHKISVIKMNIEGAEYPVLLGLNRIEVKQVCIRFHHRMDKVPYSYKDSLLCIDKFISWGYKVIYKSNHKDKNVDYEVLLIN